MPAPLVSPHGGPTRRKPVRRGPSPPAVIYRYAEDRRGRHIDDHLDGFRGVLQVDAYAGYIDLARPSRPGCAITLAYTRTP